MDNRIERVSGVIWNSIDDDVVIIGDDGTELVTLNSTAASIWKLSNGDMNARDIATKLQEQFSVDFKDVYNDVIDTINKLGEMGYLNIEGIIKNTL